MANIQSGLDTTLATVDTTYKALHVLPKGTATVAFSDADPMVDSFERLRVAEPRVAFSYSFANGIRGEYWDSAAYGAGTALPAAIAVAGAPPTLNNDVAQNLNTTTASGTGYWIQSMYHVRYVAGISNLARMTFLATRTQANQNIQIGTFTDQGTFPSNTGDGVYLDIVGTGVNITRRYLTTGTGTLEQVAQANWNLDKCNGTGASGFNLDLTKAQHLVIEWQWLGIGSVRVGFETGVSTGVVWAHEFSTPNNLSAPWCRTGSLPIRAAIYTTGVVGQAGLLKLWNCTVLQEGDVLLKKHSWRYRSFSAQVSGAVKSILSTAALGSWYPLIALRNAVTNDLTKRAMVVPTKANILVLTPATTSTALTWALLYAPTTFTGSTFAALTTEGAQVDTAGTSTTALAGGIVLASGTLANVAQTRVDLDFTYMEDNLIKMCQNAAGGLTTTGGNIIVLALGVLGAASTATGAGVFATLDWKEDV